MAMRKSLTQAQILDRTHTAVVVIDMQNDFCANGGAFDKMGVDVSAVQAVMPTLASFLKAARKAGVMVVHVITRHTELTNSPVWDWKAPPGVAQLGSWGAEMYHGCTELQPQPNEALIIKHRYSPFYNTDLDLVLRSSGMKTIVLAGVATNVCVETAARDGIMRDYYVFLMKDCTAAYDPASHEAALRNVTQRFGMVISSQEVLGFWSIEPHTAAS